MEEGKETVTQTKREFGCKMSQATVILKPENEMATSREVMELG